MKRRGISVRNKMDTFNLSFDLKELQESIDKNIINNPESSVFSHGKRAWFKDIKPEVIDQIDSQLRKRYVIGEDSKMIVCVHYPPEKDCKEKKLIIKENKENVLHRFIISSIQETCDITFGAASSETFEMRPWVSYKIPEMIGGMLSYEFKNDKNLVIPAKKGFRQVRKTKALENRYIIVLDYLISKNQYQELVSMLKDPSGDKNKEPDFSDDENIDDALDNLRS